MLSKFIFAVCLSVLPAARAADDTYARAEHDRLLNILSGELFTEFKALGKKETVPLYFLQYELFDESLLRLSSFKGTEGTPEEFRYRNLDITARFNDYSFDNTHQIKRGYGQGATLLTSASMPLDDSDEDAIRGILWKQTDEAYKKAFSDYSEARTDLAVTADEENKLPDFSPSEKVLHFDEVSMPEINKAEWQKKLNEVSAVFSKYPYVKSGNASLSVNADNRYIVNTDGSRIKTGLLYIFLSVNSEAVAKDGMALSRYKMYHAASVKDLPGTEELKKEVEKQAAELKQLIDAPVISPYNGPVLLNARAAGVYFHEIIGHRLESHRQKLEKAGQTFAKEVGRKVTADFINLYDDPTLSTLRGFYLRGHYTIDDEGVRAKRADLVRNGVLRGFMTSRSPIKDFPYSNGHARKAQGYLEVSRMGNTIIEASRTVPYRELRARLIEECKKQKKEFGLIVDDISGGFTNTSKSGSQSFTVQPLLVRRVYVDGRPDDVVRGVDLKGTPLSNFSKIISAGDDYEVFNGTCGAESGWVPVSAVSPSILISEMEVAARTETYPKPPVLPSPYEEEDR